MSPRFVEVVVAANADEDDCLVAAEATFINRNPALRGFDLSPRWTDDDRETVTLVVPAWAAEVGCECGEITGVSCEWTGLHTETVLVEYMPEQHRADHVKAGNRGRYPHNGARRFRCSAKCAEQLVDGEWIEVVS